GLNPVFCDVDPATYTIDPDAAENLISNRITGIVGVHLWGRPCDVDALTALADRHGLRLIFDASHAFGCSHGGRMVGTFGDAEVFSFHATKLLNSAEGGAIVTNDRAFADGARLMRNFGFADYDRTAGLGINGKMSELSAAMGLTSLESLPRFIAANRRNYDGYRAGLAEVPGLSLVSHEPSERHNYHDVVVDVSESEAGISRDVLQRVLWEENVLARRYFYPGAHRMEPYRSVARAGSSLPVTEHLAARTLVLPNGGEIGAEEIERVCELAAFVVENGPEIAQRLSRDCGP
ncbi:MAG: DegT/DnrJ/EryC1/StrS family aminotransferase, partial [Solirubrobacterales bacterium]